MMLYIYGFSAINSNHALMPARSLLCLSGQSEVFIESSFLILWLNCSSR